MSRTAGTPRPAGLYIAYYRVSTVMQGQSGLGLEAQRAAVASYIAGARGTLMMEYVEVESGKKDDRPQLAAAIADAKRQRATLIIAKLDRLSRNVHFISGLMNGAIDFVACDMPHANRLTLHILAAMAEHEREMISARTKAGFAAAKAEITRNGFRISRRSGKAYSKHGNPNWQPALEAANKAKRKPEQIAVEIAGMIRSQQAAGNSLREIAAKLNASGLHTASGAAWHPSSVRAALLQAA